MDKVTASETRSTGANADVNALLYGTQWSTPQFSAAPTVITYSFVPQSASALPAGSADFQAGLRAFTPGEAGIARAALASIEAVCHVRFIEVPDTSASTLRYAVSDAPNQYGFAGFAFFPSNSEHAGEVFIGTRQAAPEWADYLPCLMLHETLHALGLKHPFEGASQLSADQNTLVNTVMSYSAISGISGSSLSNYPHEPMPIDVKTLQFMYGAAARNEGDTRYHLDGADLAGGLHVLWDSQGHDVLDASGVSVGVTLNLNPGAQSSIGSSVTAFGVRTVNGAREMVQESHENTLTIADGCDIEDATGSNQADILIGNALDNRLQGGEGCDTLRGNGGRDVLDGGAGIDTAAYGGTRAGHVLQVSPSGVMVRDIKGQDGTDTLLDVERIHFADMTLALDFDGHAAQAAMILGAVAGRQTLGNADHVGRVLNLLDQGASQAEVAAFVIDNTWGTPVANVDFVNHVYANVIGQTPDAQASDYYTGLLQSGRYTQSDLAVMAAHTQENALNIDLVGLARTGIAYTPVDAVL